MCFLSKLIGFMQGRLCEPVDSKIQAFPWQDWESEFSAAADIDLHLMEWTIDHQRLYENPLMTSVGQANIISLCRKHGVSIPSLTGDCFMQSPFWKVDGESRLRLQSEFLAIGRACAAIGIKIIVVPLVDNGRLETTEQEDALIKFLLEQQHFFAENNLQVLFESDFAPTELARFISRLPIHRFGINYDIGNSAALGYDPVEEFTSYQSRIINVHVKDRLLRGGTVPLKTGAAQFDIVFAELAKAGYRGNFILQTARAVDGNHAEVLSHYHEITRQFIYQFFSSNK